MFLPNGAKVECRAMWTYISLSLLLRFSGRVLPNPRKKIKPLVGINPRNVTILQYQYEIIKRISALSQMIIDIARVKMSLSFNITSVLQLKAIHWSEFIFIVHSSCFIVTPLRPKKCVFFFNLSNWSSLSPFIMWMQRSSYILLVLLTHVRTTGLC